MLRLGELLAQLREKKGLTAYGVAQELGVNRMTIYHVESGRRKPSKMLLKHLAELYGASYEDLEALLEVAGVSDDALSRVMAMQLAAKDELMEVLTQYTPEEREAYRAFATYLTPAGTARLQAEPSLLRQAYEFLRLLGRPVGQSPSEGDPETGPYARHEG